MFRQVDADTLHAWIETGEDIRVVDVRNSNETANGVIAGAEMMPLHLLPSQADDMGTESKVVFYCQSGARSAQACSFMAARMASSLFFNLQGGVEAWSRSGRSLTGPILAEQS